MYIWQHQYVYSNPFVNPICITRLRSIDFHPSPRRVDSKSEGISSLSTPIWWHMVAKGSCQLQQVPWARLVWCCCSPISQWIWGNSLVDCRGPSPFTMPAMQTWCSLLTAASLGVQFCSTVTASFVTWNPTKNPTTIPCLSFGSHQTATTSLLESYEQSLALGGHVLVVVTCRRYPLSKML